VQEGQTVYFTTLGNTDKKIYAKLRQVEPAPNSINTETNTSSSTSGSAVYYNALFDVPNEDGKLRIDMTAQVYIVLDEARNVLTVPAAAIQGSNRPQRPNRGEGSRGSGDPSARAEGQDQARGDSKRPEGDRPPRLELSDAERALIEQGKAQRAMVRVLQADGTAKPTPVLIGLNNRVTAQVIKG